MSTIYFCPKCKATFSVADGTGKECPDCHCETVSSGYAEADWYAMPFKERDAKKRAMIAQSAPSVTENAVKEDPVKAEDTVYSLDGVRGRHIDIYENKVVLTVKVSVGSLLTGNVTDGEKTIYFSDCIGVQYKKSGLSIGYLQFETAGGLMNNKANNFFNENTFTWDTTKQSNEKMQEVAAYCKKRVDEIKSQKNVATSVVQQISPADELRKYKDHLDSGIITQEEFNAKKKQLLGL